MFCRVVVLVLLLVPGTARADRVLAGEPAAPAEDVLAPNPEETEVPASEVRAAEPRAWKLCRVRTSILASTGGRTEVAFEDESVLFHGETLDLEREVPLESNGRAALLRLKARIRAAVARDGGVIYHVTTQGTLGSAIGFASDEVGRDQTRHAYMEFEDTSTQLLEVYVSPSLGARLVLGLSVEPIFGREDTSLEDALRPAEMGPVVVFHVESLLREGDKVRLLESAPLTARLGRDVVFSLARLAAQPPEVDPAHPLGGNVLVRDLARLPDSGYGDDHSVELQAFRGDYKKAHAADVDTSFVAAHEVANETKDDPRHWTYKAKTRKLSRSQKERILRQQEIALVKEAADLRSRTLPSGETLPVGLHREDFALHLTPLHVSATSVQVEIRIVGHVKFPGEETLTSLDAVFVEELTRGEPFELGLVELARGGEPASDYIFRIQPEP